MIGDTCTKETAYGYGDRMAAAVLCWFDMAGEYAGARQKKKENRNERE